LADQQAQTLTQVNQEFNQSRATRLDSAITQALNSKLPPAPKAGKSGSTPGASTSGRSPSPPATSGTVASPAPGAPSSSTQQPTTASPDTSTPDGDADAALAALGAGADPDDTGEPALGEAVEAPAEGQQPAFDVEAVTAAATKKDLRGVEKLLGLPEGILGATNADYAAYRRRCDEVTAREKTVEQTHEANNTKLITKFGPVVDLLGAAGKGNLLAYARTIEVTTGVPIAVFVEHWAKNVRQLPPETLELQRRLSRYESPDGKPLALPEGKQEPAAVATPAVAQAKADAYIAEEAKAHPALKLKDGLKDVRAKWLGSFDPKSKSWKLTPQQAADAVVEDRRKQHEQDQWILSGRTPPVRKRTNTINRTGASETQPRKENISREELILRGAENIRRQKAADARRTGR
jgi:hypothetical protein